MASVLILEDEMLISYDLAMTLRRGGYGVVGPASSSAAAMSALDVETPDVAFLDINLGNGSTSLEVARRLFRTGVPFAFLSGYSAFAHDVMNEFPGTECIGKPCSPSRLLEAAGRLMRSGIIPAVAQERSRSYQPA